MSGSNNYHAPPPKSPAGHQAQAGSGLEDSSEPPPGPPPAHNHRQYAPPPGRRSHHTQEEDYDPPPGPPPSYEKQPGRSAVPAEPWELAVPDTCLLPPPPPFFTAWDRSPATNATQAEADTGEEWCARNPVVPPLHLDPAGLAALQMLNIRLIPPHGWNPCWCSFAADAGPGTWDVDTPSGSRDACLLAYPPLYHVNSHLPLSGARQGEKKMIYYEVIFAPPGQRRARFLTSSLEKTQVTVALGFSALPYPGFRMPGWHRASLAVHGDDGHRYVNDMWGGKEFTDPFRMGETVGIGMIFSCASVPAYGFAAEAGKVKVEVFVTRDGRKVGGWPIDEPLDLSQDRPVTGLEGLNDIAAAIGTFDQTRFRVVFAPRRWRYEDARRAYGIG